MLADFFQLSSIPANQMLGSYDLRLVLLSYCVATFASYIALDIAGRLRDIGNSTASCLLWILGGAFAMGAGIWSMHFIGMLAFTIPGMDMIYNPYWTGASMLVAITASAFALYLLKEQAINVTRLGIGGVILGLGIASMHYVGMAAMSESMIIHYMPGLFVASIIIAIVSSEAALWLALKSNQVIHRLRVRLKIVSALIMGAAICGMHYTGMAAAVFTMTSGHMHSNSTTNQDILAISIAGVTFIILSIAFLASAYKDALNQQSLLKARQAGMAEVAATVLHNVGNVLNSIVVSAECIDKRIEKSKLDNLTKLNILLDENKHSLDKFISTDERGKQIPKYISELAHYWMTEKEELLREARSLLNNISHVKSIVSLQQQLSKTSSFEQIIAINELLDEALLVTGIGKISEKIHIEKKYASLDSINLDKVKLLQILINILHNAKDSVLTANSTDKKITIETGTSTNKMFFIKITDTGVGILPENLTRIFSYGFTTKHDGHGFGLHSSAIAANEMGGSIAVTSAGEGKGATFIIELPYHFSGSLQNKLKQKSAAASLDHSN